MGEKFSDYRGFGADERRRPTEMACTDAYEKTRKNKQLNNYLKALRDQKLI